MPRDLDDRGELELILADWRERCDRGEHVTPEEVISSHPDLADELRDHFDALALVSLALDGGVRTGVPQRIGDFEVLREIGRGGMGVVFEAEQVPLRRKVALKILSLAITSTPRAVKRFQREAQAAARLHHTNIVPIYGLGQHAGYWYYTMELVEGRSLADVLSATRGTGPTEHAARETAPSALVPDTRSGSHAYYARIAEMFAAVAEGLHLAHESGVIHRDMKPSNLLLDGAGTLKIIDFGLALMADEGAAVTATGDRLGTPAYMSPEQAAGKRDAIDRRTDVYSLGATLYEVLTLAAPFAGSSAPDVCARIATRDPLPPRRRNGRVPRDLETIVLKAMEKERHRRYTTAQELARDLRRFAEGAAVHARRIGPLGRAWRRVRRQKAISALAAGLLVAVAATAFFMHRSAVEKRRRVELSYAQLCARAEESMIRARLSNRVVEQDGPLVSPAPSTDDAGSSLFAGVVEQSAPVMSAVPPTEDARALLSEAIALLPDRVDAHFLRALAPGAGYDERWSDLQRARECGLGPRLFHLVHGLILAQSKRFAEAEAEYEKAREHPGDSAMSALFEARILMTRGRRTEAEQLVTRALDSRDLGPMMLPRAYHLRASLRRLRHEWDDALADLYVLQSLEPSVRTGAEIALVLLRTNTPVAERRFGEALEGARAAGSEDAWAELCIAVRDNANWHARAVAAALDAHPYGRRVLYEQHLVLEARDDTNGLLQLAALAREKWPEHPMHYEFLAKARARQWDLGGALEAWNRAIELADDRPHLLGRRASLLRRLGRPDEALADYERALAIDPMSSPNLFNRATLLMDMGRYPEAQRAFEEAAESSPDDADGLSTWGAGLNNVLNRPEEALECFKKAIDANPNHATAWENLGVLLQRLGQREKAVAAFETVLRLRPGDGKTHWRRLAQIRRLRGVEAALAATEEVIEARRDDPAVLFWCGYASWAFGRVQGGFALMKAAVEKDPDPERLLVYADCFRRADELDEAERIWLQLLEIPDPGLRARVLCDRGNAREHGDPDAALRDYRQAAEEFPRHPSAWAAIAKVLCRKQQYDDALEANRKAIEIEPHQGRWWARIATTYLAMKRPDDARAAVDKAVELGPRDPGLHVARGSTLYRLRNLKKAERACMTALELDQECSDAYYWLGPIYEARRHWDAAVGAYRKMYELEPSSLNAHVHAVELLKKLGRYKEELEELDKLLAKWPRDYWARFEAGLAYSGLGLYPEAIDAFRFVLKELKAGDVEAQGNIARSFWKMGRYDEAVTEYAKAFEMDPENARLHAQAGVCHLENRRYARAIDCFTTALKFMQEAENANRGVELYLRFWRGWALRERGELEKALAEQEALARDAPEDASSRAEIAWLLALLGRFGEVREPLDAAKGFSADWDTLERRAQTLGVMGEHDEALQAARKLMKKFAEGSPETLIHCLRAAGRPDEARERARKAAERAQLPGEPIGVAYVYAVAGDPERAHAILDSYPHPWVWTAMHVRARTHAVLGEKEAALEWLGRAVTAGLRLPLPDPELALLSGEPRYEALLRRMRGG